MKRIILPALIIGSVLLLLSYAVLYLTINFAPKLVEEYYNPLFWPGSDRAWLFFVHPYILGIALAWFWNRFKSLLRSQKWQRGLEMGIIYGMVATLPSMWITFSALAVSLTMVLSWFAYGLLQALVAGLLLTRINP